MIQHPRAATQPKPHLPGCTTVFLDRHGTVNVKASHGKYITLPTELSLIPGAPAAISRLNAADIRVILVTNQRWLPGPASDPTSYAQVHTRLEELLAEAARASTRVITARTPVTAESLALARRSARTAIISKARSLSWHRTIQLPNHNDNFIRNGDAEVCR